jgi:galactose mutarotase-like enzyme
MTSNWIRLTSSALEAQVDPRGAQLSVLRDAHGRDLLWHGDPAVWASRAPILFPIVGTLSEGVFHHDGRRYSLPRHGLARTLPFDVMTVTPRSALLRLHSDDSTLAAYPFPFSLDVGFALDGATLAVTASVRNTGTDEMPMSVGFHPGFVWPLPYGKPRADHALEFESDEPAPIRRLDARGLVAPQIRPTPVRGRRLPLDDALFAEDVIIFERLRSKSLNYGAPEGPKLQVGFPDASHLGIWTRPGAGFVCIEPWQGVADSQGPPGELRNKPGIVRLAPGELKALHMTVTLLSG